MVDPLSTAFSALADPTRRAILARLAQGEATVNELADPLRDQPAGDLSASQSSRRRWPHFARPRGTVATVQVEPERLKAVDDWLSVYRRFWEQSLDRMAAYLEELGEGESSERPKKKRR